MSILAMRKRSRPTEDYKNLDGVLNIDKPPEMTSHDVVDAVRRIAGIRKVGHTGTLDPMATGVLPLCLGNATRIQEFLVAQDKEYRVQMRLGITTVTQDTSGEVVEERGLESINKDIVRETLQRFVGPQSQIPPMVSAKHHKGKRLYELARKGVEVKRAPCKITIYELEIEKIALPHVTYRVVCSKGTYIRTLCHDLGRELGTGAAMSDLIRTRCGAFAIENAVALESMKGPEDVRRYLASMSESLSNMPSVLVGHEGAQSLGAGRALLGVSVAQVSAAFETGDRLRIVDRQGTLLGVGEALLPSDQINGMGGNLRVVKPVKVFAGQQ
ncbi:MAG TPA: tRNA pseudouridine(55) synthase TruB [bacterium]|nr:tRNA pseudouridine(55) synthase TruB [bacterium]